jgi:hypothetical protein
MVFARLSARLFARLSACSAWSEIIQQDICRNPRGAASGRIPDNVAGSLRAPPGARPRHCPTGQDRRREMVS